LYIKIEVFYESPFFRSDPKEYALKQIEGSGLSMSACREIAVRTFFCRIVSLIVHFHFHFSSIAEFTASLFVERSSTIER
jgi:hypothetical protein